MPDCYHVISSSPEEAGKDIKECVDKVGGPGKLKKLKTDGKRTYSFVQYEDREVAYKYLGPLTDCIAGKGHEIHDARVLEDFEELGLTVPGYPPEGSAAA